MPGKIVNHFRILLAQKATKQQQNIALMDVQRETGVAWSTLNSLLITSCPAMMPP